MNSEHENTEIVPIGKKPVQICEDDRPDATTPDNAQPITVTVRVGTLVHIAPEGGLSIRSLSTLLTRLFSGQQ